MLQKKIDHDKTDWRSTVIYVKISRPLHKYNSSFKLISTSTKTTWTKNCYLQRALSFSICSVHVKVESKL